MDNNSNNEINTDLIGRRPTSSKVIITSGQDLYKNNIGKSIGKDKKSRFAKMNNKKYNIKKVFVAGAIIALLSAGAVVATKHIINDINNNNIVKEELSDYNELVSNESHANPFYNDTTDIASALQKDQMNIDEGIYGVYCANELGYNETSRLEAMDKIVGHITFLSPSVDDPNIAVEDTWKTFGDYVADGLGYKNEDGTPNYKAYSKAMEEKIVEEAKADLGIEQARAK